MPVKSVTRDEFDPSEEPTIEASLPALKRLFGEADRTTKRAFWMWLLEYGQLHADQGLSEED